MVRQVGFDKIKAAMFEIGEGKAPGPYSFTSAFFKSAWNDIGNDVCKAVVDFFTNRKMLREINSTVIALLPEVTNPSKVTDYRPISCCNMNYKRISRIITNRMKEGLVNIVSENQSAFVPGRSISDNILLTQELVKRYHLQHGTPRCAFKIDIQKAYDTFDWSFLRVILECFGFHNTMIKWIMACVTTTLFSINVNGDMHGFFSRETRVKAKGFDVSIFIYSCHGGFNAHTKA